VRLVSRKHLRRFCASRKHDSDQATKDLEAWRQIAEDARWKDFSSLKQTFGFADQVGNCVVFDVGNNRYRLIGRVMFGSGKIYVLKVMDHSEYDKKKWIEDCGCKKPPPKKRTTR